MALHRYLGDEPLALLGAEAVSGEIPGRSQSVAPYSSTNLWRCSIPRMPFAGPRLTNSAKSSILHFLKAQCQHKVVGPGSQAKSCPSDCLGTGGAGLLHMANRC